jgi:hypothetical protein
MTEYTSLEISRRLAEAGFKIKGDMVGWEPGVNFKDSGENFWRYRADALLTWLMTEPVFSKRAWSIRIARVAKHVKGDEWKEEYRVAADAGDGNEICKFAPILCDALGEVVIKVKEADNAHHD